MGTNPFASFKSTHHPMEWQRVATALVKEQGLHEGLWRVFFKFDLRVANVNMGEQLVPAAFLPVVAMGLMRVTELDPLTVDAAVVNPEVRIIRPHAVM